MHHRRVPFVLAIAATLPPSETPMAGRGSPTDRAALSASQYKTGGKRDLDGIIFLTIYVVFNTHLQLSRYRDITVSCRMPLLENDRNGTSEPIREVILRWGGELFAPSVGTAEPVAWEPTVNLCLPIARSVEVAAGNADPSAGSGPASAPRAPLTVDDARVVAAVIGQSARRDE